MRARIGVHEGAAAGGKDDGAFLQQAADHPRLALAKVGLAMDGENVGDRHAGRRLDLGVRILEGKVQARAEAPADRALAGAHEPDQNHGASPEPLPDSLLDRAARGLGGRPGEAGRGNLAFLGHGF